MTSSRRDPRRVRPLRRRGVGRLDFYLAGCQLTERPGIIAPAGGVPGDYIFARLLECGELNAGTFGDRFTNLHELPELSRVANLALGAAVNLAKSERT